MIIQFSPNYNNRPSKCPIDTLVIHYTGMGDFQSALTRLCDPNAEVSAHYLINENGQVYNLVCESKRAWHAGVSFWRGRSNINDCSIGIELVNPGHDFGYRPFSKSQMISSKARSGTNSQRGISQQCQKKALEISIGI